MPGDPLRHQGPRRDRGSAPGPCGPFCLASGFTVTFVPPGHKAFADEIAARPSGLGRGRQSLEWEMDPRRPLCGADLGIRLGAFLFCAQAWLLENLLKPSPWGDRPHRPRSTAPSRGHLSTLSSPALCPQLSHCNPLGPPRLASNLRAFAQAVPGSKHCSTHPTHALDSRGSAYHRSRPPHCPSFLHLPPPPPRGLGCPHTWLCHESF